jgi:hypothetical protein
MDTKRVGARMDECNKLQVDKCVEYYRGVEEK